MNNNFKKYITHSQLSLPTNKTYSFLLTYITFLSFHSHSCVLLVFNLGFHYIFFLISLLFFPYFVKVPNMGRKRGTASKDLNLTSIMTSIRRGLSSKDNEKSSTITNKKKKDDQTFIDIGQPSLNHQNMETSNASDDFLDNSPDQACQIS